MNNQTKELLEKISDKADWGLSLVTKETLKPSSKISISSFKKQIATSVINAKLLPIDSINFSGENPFIYIKQLKEFNPTQVRELHRKIWNEGRTPLLGIITPTEIRLYDCFDFPADTEVELDKCRIGKIYRNTKQDIEELAVLLHQSKIDSGLIWDEPLGKNIKTKNRVDRKLVENLAIAREKLHSQYKMPFNVVHDLLGRSLFTLYLQDRGILKPENYPQKKSVSDFFELLDYPKATIELFDYLKRKFNGDLFPVTEEERILIENNPQALLLIKDCFIGSDLISNQLSFNWRLFQFQYIPIELISSIYEEFMSVEDEEHIGFKKEQKKKNDGAFYTPPMLVEFVLNEVLPYPDENNKRYDLKILDPACGSGIFLVESYKRLIARWKYSNKKPEITEEVLEELLLNNIYGIEYDAEAIKVAAFSLYLTYLDYIRPTKVLDKDARFEPLIRWKDKQTKGNKKQGNSLFQFSTFSKELTVFENEFDLVVGNPPWLRGGLKKDVEDYINNNNLPKDIVCAYLDYIPKVTPNAIIALITKSKVFFNTSLLSEQFKYDLFTRNNVESVINFSVVRNVIFENARAAAAVLIYSKRKNTNTPKSYVIYCVPKSELIIKNRRSIVIDASEVKFIPLVEILKDKSKAFKIAMWGNLRDLKLIEKLNTYGGIIKKVSEENHGMGLIKDKSAKKKGNLHLSNHLFLDTNSIQPYYTSSKKLSKLGHAHKLYRTDLRKQLYDSPLLLFKEGASEKICTSLIDFKCVFQSSALGVRFKDVGVGFYKAMIVCLNSTLATYYYLMTSSSLGVDRERVQKNEILEFPSFLFHFNENVIAILASLFDKIYSFKLSKNEAFERVNIEKLQENIDQIIYKELNFSVNEIALINDALNFSVALRSRYTENKAESSVIFDKELLLYARILAKTITSSLKNSKKGAWVEVLDTGTSKQPINIVAVHFDNDKEFGSAKISTINDISKLIQQINIDSYQKLKS
ncbi:HsdM family class I SAM-dependent methyltransferase, partial [Ferruginibacter sp.]